MPPRLEYKRQCGVCKAVRWLSSFNRGRAGYGNVCRTCRTFDVALAELERKEALAVQRIHKTRATLAKIRRAKRATIAKRQNVTPTMDSSSPHAAA